MALDRAGLLAQAVKNVEEVRIAGLPDTIFVRVMTASESFGLAEYSDKCEDNGQPKDVAIAYRMLELTLSDKDGNRLFDDGEGKQLGDLGVDLLNDIIDTVRRVNGLDPGGPDPAEQEEDLAGKP